MGCGESNAAPHGKPAKSGKSGKSGGKGKAELTPAAVQAARGAGTEKSVIRELEQVGMNLNSKKPASINPSPKSCFICCNSYTRADLKLGVGPINDSLLVAQNHKRRGYTVYFLHNSKPDIFKAFLIRFFDNTTTALTVYFTGHGGQVKDLDGDESDGFDEAMVFDTGHVLDDDLAVLVRDHLNGKTRVLLLTDCCHSGSIWDLQSTQKRGWSMPANVISLSGCADEQTAKQMKVDARDQGLFTHLFWKYCNADPNASPKSLNALINAGMKSYGQRFVVCTTTESMLTKPLFR
jgi:hypothetical protein